MRLVSCPDRNLDHAVQPVLEDAVGFFDILQCVCVRDQRRGIDPAFLDQLQRLCTVAAVHAAGLEDQVLAVHVGQGERLRAVVEGDNRDDRIWARAFPRHVEGGLGTGDLQHNVRAAVIGVGENEILQAVRFGGQYIGVVLADKVQPGFIDIANDDALRVHQSHALQRADAGRARADDQHGVFRLNLRNLRRPVAGGQYIAHEQRLFVRHGVGDLIQSLIGIGHAHIFSLSAVDAAAQRPAAVGIGAVVYPSVLAEEALAAEGFHIHGYAVAGFDGGDGAADFLNHAHHLMAHGDARDGPGHAAVLDVQIAGADAGKGHADDGVAVVLECGAGLFQKFELSLVGVCIGKHGMASLCF